MPYEPETSALRRPTPARPLLGLTVLAVEDSRFASDALRLMCLKSGARLRRADSLRAARRHLQVYRPTVTIVDLGLPDGCGADLIAELAQASPRVTVLLGTSGDSFAEGIAVAAGADGFLPKPLSGLGQFQATLLAHLPDDQRPIGPRVLATETVTPDPIAYRDDLAHAAELLQPGADRATCDYVVQFLSGLARTASDSALLKRVSAFGDGPSMDTQTALAGFLHTRLQDRIAI